MRVGCGACQRGFIDLTVAVVVDFVAGDFIEARADEFRIGNCRALGFDVAAVAAADRDTVAVEVFHAVDFSVAVEVILGLVCDVLSALEIGDGHDHADAVAPFVAGAGLSAGFACADAGSTGWAVIAGTRFAVGAVAFGSRLFAAVGHILVAIDIVGLACGALTFDACDVCGAFGTAGTAVIGVVLEVVAEAVFAAGLVRAVDAASVIAKAVFAAFIAACAAVMDICQLVGAEVVADFLAFGAGGIGDVAVGIFIGAAASAFAADFASEADFSAVAAVLGIAQDIDACVVADGLAFGFASVDASALDAPLAIGADIAASTAVLVVVQRIEADVVADNLVFVFAVG